MKKTTGFSLILIALIGLIIAGAFYTQHTIEEGINLPSLAELRKSQPIMPGMDLPKMGQMPNIEGISSWINSGPLNKVNLEGKVVLVDFWTYSCVNCLRTLPFVTSWHEKYAGEDFVILGIHTPEFDFEKDRKNVQTAVKKNNIGYPVALDNDFVTWQNFNNRFWPAKYLFDKDGILRYSHFGEGKYEETELAIQQLLGTDQQVTQSATPDFSKIGSPETYFGFNRGERFASPEKPQAYSTGTYSFPSSLPLNTWALEGEWNISETYSQVVAPGARFRFKYNASAANLVLTVPNDENALIKVFLDGKPVPSEFLGADLRTNSLGQTEVLVDEPKLYFLIKGTPGEHELEIQTDKPGVRIYAITFG